MIFNFIKKYKALSLLIFAAFISHLLISFPSGSYYCFNKNCGLYFWGAHEHDALWHLAIIETAFKKFPPQHPVFAGENLTGYNYFLDFIIFLLAKSGISSIVWYFKIIPIIWFILYTYLSIKLAQKISSSYWFKVFFLFFNYFGASFVIFFTLFHKKTIWGSSSSLAMQSLLSLVNPQFAISLIFFLLILLNYFEKKALKKRFLYGLYIFINFGLKFYGGVISLFLVLFFILTERKEIKNKIIDYLSIFLFSLIAIIIFYQPFSAGKSGAPLTFSPFSMVHHIIEEKDLFYLPKLVNARYFLYQFGWGPKLLLIELFSVFLFVFFNFGVRFFSLIYIIRKFLRKKINFYYLVIFFTILFSITLTVLFIQKGVWWNTIQFIYYGLFLGNIFTGLFLERLLKKKKLIYLFIILILLLVNIPENIDVLKGFNPLKKGSFISNDEIKALIYLNKQPDGVVFSPYQFLIKENKKIKDSISDSAYISAFSGKQTYLNDTHVLEITGVNYKKRAFELNNIETLNFKKLNVKYLYLVKDNKSFEMLFEKIKKQMNYRKIYENNQILIIKNF